MGPAVAQRLQDLPDPTAGFGLSFAFAPPS